MTEPVIARKEPIIEDLKAGETYWRRRCGRSKTQPDCDGSHAGTGFKPMEFKPATDMKVGSAAADTPKSPPSAMERMWRYE